MNETLTRSRRLCVFLSRGIQLSSLRTRSSLSIWVEKLFVLTVSSELQRNELPVQRQKWQINVILSPRRLWLTRRRKEREASQNSCTCGKVCGRCLCLAAKCLFMESFSYCFEGIPLITRIHRPAACDSDILWSLYGSFLPVSSNIKLEKYEAGEHKHCFNLNAR